MQQGVKSEQPLCPNPSSHKNLLSSNSPKNQLFSILPENVIPQ